MITSLSARKTVLSLKGWKGLTQVVKGKRPTVDLTLRNVDNRAGPDAQAECAPGALVGGQLSHVSGVTCTRLLPSEHSC